MCGTCPAFFCGDFEIVDVDRLNVINHAILSQMLYMLYSIEVLCRRLFSVKKNKMHYGYFNG